ncbi:hypothetical protein Q4Q35_16315 [Flavivirga aquimarina]|uniref:YceI family protein n=1 Tax=Flavivirga aquimarina TaxID=2027862 RepID=A0ABT8WDY3_9FLAO|nr:hypothetical protein [Flavivirga aquimarina]MDO5971372.1 hypothetical protein [Flavivirga aquimarina]
MSIFDFLKKKGKTSESINEEIPSYKEITVNLQTKTSAEKGIIEKYWFENKNIGIDKTLLHRIEIPLKPFNSGFEYETQPLKTTLVFDFLKLDLQNPNEIHGIIISSDKESDVDASVYVGNVHNPFDIDSLTFKKVKENEYQVKGKIMVDFEDAMLAKNETFEFSTTVEFKHSE